jgi:hypothetical protein
MNPMQKIYIANLGMPLPKQKPMYWGNPSNVLPISPRIAEVIDHIKANPKNKGTSQQIFMSPPI